MREVIPTLTREQIEAMLTREEIIRDLSFLEKKLSEAREAEQVTRDFRISIEKHIARLLLLQKEKT